AAAVRAEQCEPFASLDRQCNVGEHVLRGVAGRQTYDLERRHAPDPWRAASAITISAKVSANIPSALYVTGHGRRESGIGVGASQPAAASAARSVATIREITYSATTQPATMATTTCPSMPIGMASSTGATAREITLGLNCTRPCAMAQ